VKSTYENISKVLELVEADTNEPSYMGHQPIISRDPRAK